jgi:dipeptidase E
MKLVILSDQQYPDTNKIGLNIKKIMDKKYPNIGYISSSPDSGKKYFSERKKYYSKLNIQLTEYIDLEDGFNDSTMNKIFNLDAIHLSGGDTSRFLYWIKKRKLGKRLIQYAKTGGTLIGVSAGAIIMTPDTSIISLYNNTDTINSNTKGLKILPFHYIPHVDTEKKIDNKILIKSKKEKITVIASGDKDGIIYNRTGFQIFGSPILIIDGVIKDIREIDKIKIKP